MEVPEQPEERREELGELALVRFGRLVVKVPAAPAALLSSPRVSMRL